MLLEARSRASSRFPEMQELVGPAAMQRRMYGMTSERLCETVKSEMTLVFCCIKEELTRMAFGTEL